MWWFKKGRNGKAQPKRIAPRIEWLDDAVGVVATSKGATAVNGEGDKEFLLTGTENGVKALVFDRRGNMRQVDLADAPQSGWRVYA
jgi:hypothetical protein